jgi:hypothetical protein
MPAVTMRRKRPVEVRTLEWTGDNLDELLMFCGPFPDGSAPLFTGPDPADGIYASARVWNSEERDWINVPVGHHLVAGPLGEFYPISPEALARTYDPADDALAESERTGLETHARLLAACDANLTGDDDGERA